MTTFSKWFATGAIAAIGLFSLVGSTIADEKASGDHPAKAALNDDDVAHHATLGVSLSETATGVRVIAVLPASPAAKAGIQVGDEIRYLGEQRVRTAHDLIEEVGEYRPGSVVQLTIRRNGEQQVLTAKLGSQATAQKPPRRAPETRFYSTAPSAPSRQQQLSDRVRNLQNQLMQLQQELNRLQGEQFGQQPAWTGGRAWNAEQRRGEANDDPALFQ
jgi:membrane-associated protease RseP (regulator of RpoE activity)